jgi:hypothetical protein
VGGVGGVSICFIGKSDPVVSQNTLRDMHAGARGMLSSTGSTEIVSLIAQYCH